ncbi:lipoprotein releasing system transmembrane protein LolC/E family [Candidatus Magnetoovum chiemensis]|nr:lipoprotein releasing system transmembrane protein LolC/E family [Candidatus Magnetoovum chiemensis]
MGVTLGVTAMLIVMSVMSGFHNDLQKKILGVSTHIVVLSTDGAIYPYMEISERLKELDHVVDTSPFVLGQVMAAHGRASQGVFLRGVVPTLEEQTSELNKFTKLGSFSALKEKDDGIIIGLELAKTLGVTLNDEINIISPVGDIGPLGMIPKTKKFTVVGIFEVGMYEYDSGLAVVGIKKTQDFFKLEGAATGIEVKIDDIYKAAQVRDDINKSLGYPFFARDWMQMNKNLFSALKLEKLAMAVILILIIFVAAFNIVSSLIMNVIEKEREIAILKAMGANRRGILLIFMIQGLFIGIIGTIAGVTLGGAICYALNEYELIKLPGDVYYLTYLPAKMNIYDFLTVSVSAVAISFLSTLYPAYRASRLNPIEPLRFE